ncbi:MAG: LD-carboxypeptidase [Muribaculum sp.]|nr:LD-carboxypeptidase [Muribaculaceae bacterium]MCM1081200.1 LD-carboxypeptidase [Muribaculum sp.]
MEGTHIFPSPLHEGSRIALLSPASIINPDVARSAIAPLEHQGWRPYFTPHALGQSGTYSGTVDARLSDLSLALDDKATDAIICTRGGYGAVHMLERFPIDKFREQPRWLVGYSDVSALHALLFRAGIASIHAPMCKHIGSTEATLPATKALYDILRGEMPCYQLPTSPLSITGEAKGKLTGGNLAVLQALIGTPYNVIGLPDTILFVEDIAEPIYKIERIFYQLRLSGALSRITGLIIGQFTEYRASASYADMYSMLRPLVEDLPVPVVFNFPVGHVENNLPLISGATVMLSVTAQNTILQFEP